MKGNELKRCVGCCYSFFDHRQQTASKIGEPLAADSPEGMLKWAEKSGNREARISSLSGYLWKMKRKHKFHLPQWNKRWFSIEGKVLKWYAKEDSKTPSGQISLLDINSMNRFESSGGVFSFIIYSRERSLFLRAETLKNMEMWFRAIQMHADLARGGNGFTILSNQTTTTPPKNRFKKQTSLYDQLEKATKALTELEKTVDLKNDCREIGLSIVEPDVESTKYHYDGDEVKEDPFYSKTRDVFYNSHSSTISIQNSRPLQPSQQSQPPQPSQQQAPLPHSRYHRDDSLEDSTESLENIVPVPVRKPASHHHHQHQQQQQQQSQQRHLNQNQIGTFPGVKERCDEERDLSTRSGGSSNGSGHAWT